MIIHDTETTIVFYIAILVVLLKVIKDTINFK